MQVTWQSEEAQDQFETRRNEPELNTQKSIDDSEGGSESSVEPPNIFTRLRHRCGSIVNDERVQLGIVILIIINAIIMGIATFDFVDRNVKLSKTFGIVDKVFLVVFTLEVIMQLIYRGYKLFQNGWLTFDFFVVVTSWALSEFQVARAFRIFRVFRLITRIKPLRDIVVAIGAVLPKMYAIGALLLLVFYIYGVLFTELFKDAIFLNDDGVPQKWFSTLYNSLFTCFELMTLEWAGIAREVMKQFSWAWIPFLSFISVTGFIVFNLIVAVVCDAIAVVQKRTEKEEQEEQQQHGEVEVEEKGPDLDTELCQAQPRIEQLTSNVADMMKDQREMHWELRQMLKKMRERTFTTTIEVPKVETALQKLRRKAESLKLLSDVQKEEMKNNSSKAVSCPALVVADCKAALESPSTNALESPSSHARTAARKAALEEKKLRLEELKIRRDSLVTLSPKSNGDPLYDPSISDSAASLSDRVEPLISDVQKEEMVKNSSKQ